MPCTGRLFFISRDLRRNLPLVKFLCVLTMIFGGGMVAIDIAVGMPLKWVVWEGPIIIPFGGFMLWLACRIPQSRDVGA
jgi:hypothetical protein